MNHLSRAIRRFSPRLYVKMNIAQINRDIRKLRTAGFASVRITRTPEEKTSIRRLMTDLQEFEEWQQALDDKRLTKKAAKIGVYLDEIEFSSVEDDSDFSRNYGRYYYSGEFGGELFRPEFRRPLIKSIRDREPLYYKERRDRVEFYVKIITTIVTGATGAIGAAIGLLAIIKK